MEAFIPKEILYRLLLQRQSVRNPARGLWCPRSGGVLKTDIMEITITYKGTTVSIDSGRSHKFEPDEAMQIISETIDKIKQSCNNCTLDKSEEYGMETD